MEPDDAARPLGELGSIELDAVVATVRALVDEDRATLERIGAYEHGDPYEPTLRWRQWPKVDLVPPAGDPADWEGEVHGDPTPDNPWVAVDVRMWTAQEEGPSELWLHLEIAGTQVRYGGMW